MFLDIAFTPMTSTFPNTSRDLEIIQQQQHNSMLNGQWEKSLEEKPQVFIEQQQYKSSQNSVSHQDLDEPVSNVFN